MDDRANLTALDRRFAPSFVARDQQDDTVARRNGAIKAGIQRFPRPVQGMAMKVENPVDHYLTRTNAPIPAAVQCPMLDRHGRGAKLVRRS